MVTRFLRSLCLIVATTFAVKAAVYAGGSCSEGAATGDVKCSAFSACASGCDVVNALGKTCDSTGFIYDCACGNRYAPGCYSCVCNTWE